MTISNSIELYQNINDQHTKVSVNNAMPNNEY